MGVETCCKCDEPTGRAGKGDDSLYRDDRSGPYCEGCFEATPAEKAAFVAEKLGLEMRCGHCKSAPLRDPPWRCPSCGKLIKSLPWLCRDANQRDEAVRAMSDDQRSDYGVFLTEALGIYHNANPCAVIVQALLATPAPHLDALYAALGGPK